MRFFHLIFEAAHESDTEENEHVGETALEEFARRFALDVDGSELVTWDVAVGCLALSVKASLCIQPDEKFTNVLPMS